MYTDGKNANTNIAKVNILIARLRIKTRRNQKSILGYWHTKVYNSLALKVHGSRNSDYITSIHHNCVQYGPQIMRKL